jgi:hypothetical protein
VDSLEVKHPHMDMHTGVRCQANRKVVFKLQQLKWKQYKDSNSLVSLKVKLPKPILHVIKTKNTQLTSCLNLQWKKMISKQVQESLSQCSHQINSPLAVAMVEISQAVVMEVTNQKEVVMVAMDLHSMNEFDKLYV